MFLLKMKVYLVKISKYLLNLDCKLVFKNKLLLKKIATLDALTNNETF